MERKYVSFELRALGNLMHRQASASETCRQIDNITATNGWVIGFLVENSDRDIFQRDLEAQFSIRRSTASKILQLMEKKGLIIRESVKHDARLKKLVLTPRAKELLKLATNDMLSLEQRLTHGLTEEELSCFFAVTEKLKNNLSHPPCCASSKNNHN